MHRLYSIILLVSILFISLFSAVSAQTGTTYYAAPTGSETNSGQDPGSPWPLAHALKQLNEGDTLLVMAGDYTASDVVQLRLDQSGNADAPITVKAHSDTNPPVIRDGVAIHFQGAAWWVLDGLIFEQFEKDPARTNKKQIIKITQRDEQISNNITIRNCIFRDTRLEAITLLHGQDVLVENNDFERINTTIPGESAHGIDILKYADRVTIRNNRFEDIAADGIHMGATPTPDIKQVTVEGNTFRMTTDQGVEGENGVDIKEVDGPVTISHNDFRGFRPTVKDGPGHKGGSNGAGLGIHLGAQNVTVAGNYFEDNTINLSVADQQDKGKRATANILVVNNIFKDARDYPGLGDERPSGAGIGLYLNSISQTIEIYHNTFTGNDASISMSPDPVVVTFQNNAIGGGTVKASSGSIFTAGHNAWSQINGGVPAELAGANDVAPDDLRLDPNLRPLADSLVINQGLDAGVQTDYAGNPRVDDLPDIGAFEFQAPPVPALQNPGFETCTFDSWVVEPELNAVISNTVHSGDCAALLHGDGKSLVSQVVTDLPPYSSYLVTGWGRVAQAGDRVHIGAMNYVVGGGGTFGVVTDDVYRFTTTTFTTDERAKAKIYCKRPASSGPAYCDDLTLVPLTPLLGNPGFESGALYPWQIKGTDVEVVADNAHSGSRAVRLGERGDQALHRVGGLQPHTTYLLTGWGKVDQADGRIIIGARNYDGTGAKRESQIESDVYTFAAVTFTTGNKTRATISCTYINGSTNAYCDDLRLTPFPTDEGVITP